MRENRQLEECLEPSHERGLSVIHEVTCNVEPSMAPFSSYVKRGGQCIAHVPSHGQNVP